MVGGTPFHINMNDIGTFPLVLWWLICLFLPPPSAMKLLKTHSFFNRMCVRWPIIQSFMTFLMERLVEYIPHRSMLMALLC